MNRPDFAALRQEGVALVQALTGTTWTDYNLHDPGVTILEALCYALTDLSYRTDFPITDILAGPDGRVQPGDNTFFSKSEILVSNPVTALDYRKLIIDQLEEVYNVWLEPLACNGVTESLQGLYRCTVQVHKELAPQVLSSPSFVAALSERVRRCFVAHRNVCEDISDPIVVLKPVGVTVKADVEVTAGVTPEEVLSNIYSALSAAFCPPLPFYSEEMMRAAGYTVEEMYAGPLLAHGFLPDDALSERLRTIDPSDLIKAISDVEGVTYVRSIYVNTLDDVPLDTFFLFKDNRTDSPIHLFRDGYAVPITEAIFNDYHTVRKQSARQAALGGSSVSSELLSGTYRNLAEYVSVQYLFPTLYGLVEERFRSDTSPAEKGQIKQLKAYLLFFEQVLANYLAQLGSLRTFFSPSALGGTHASQPLTGVPGIRTLLVDPAGYSAVLDGYTESPEQQKARKHKILDHLLARFNETVSLYPVQQAAALYGASAEDALTWKARLLQNIAVSGRDRNRGFDYLGQEGGLSSGLGEKVADLLAIRGNRVHDLSAPVRQLLSEAGGGAGSRVGADTGRGLRVTGQKMDFFRTGLEAGSYSVIPSAGGGYDLHFVPSGQVLGHFDTTASAQKAIQGMVRTLQQINIDSEGFHVVEHILLRPALDSLSYGFRFYDMDQRVLLQHLQWTTFNDRAGIISTLLDAARTSKPSAQGLADWSGQCRMLLDQYKSSGWLVDPGTLRPQDKQQADASYNEICQTLSQFINRRVQSFPRFNMLVRGPGDQLLDEPFFNFTMTVVLPAWPARFQDPNFKDFVEAVFRVHTPAHIRLRFIWAGIKRMTVFEQLYGRWAETLRVGGSETERLQWAERILSFLLGNQSSSL
ncbi:MAG TPA: hypothetical protein VL547_18460 [Dinghuibacter sp.]|uniref:hypothetical protein n=1 Tax=Dinghuibacter sp. TaxID=2024697 RepID=UPI002B9EE10B|nr:hypothetical protein [Dinghuibacter sp.]HTJ14030.1 hypothetical protein [Dinghuibacter sp.]